MTAAAAVAAEVATSFSLAPLALGLAAATGQLHLDDALGQDVVDVRFGVDRVAVPDLRSCQAQQCSRLVHNPAVAKPPVNRKSFMKSFRKSFSLLGSLLGSLLRSLLVF